MKVEISKIYNHSKTGTLQCRGGYLSSSPLTLFEVGSRYEDDPDPVLGEVILSGITVYALVSLTSQNRSVKSPWILAADYFIDLPNGIGPMPAVIVGSDNHFMLLSVTLSRRLKFPGGIHPMYCNVSLNTYPRKITYVGVPICPPANHFKKSKDGTAKRNSSRPSLNAVSGSHQYFLTATTMVLNKQISEIPEWIAYHVLQGFEHFFIYINDIFVPKSYESLRPFIKSSLITLINYEPHPELLGSFLYQRIQQNGCNIRLRHISRWVALMDVDEFFQTRMENKTVRYVLENVLKMDHGVHVRSVFFGKNAVNNSVDEARAAYLKKMNNNISLITERYVTRAHEVFQSNREKIIAAPECTAVLSVHVILEATCPKIYVSDDLLRLAHYKLPETNLVLLLKRKAEKDSFFLRNTSDYSLTVHSTDIRTFLLNLSATFSEA